MGHLKPASPQIAKRNALLSAYCTELDQLREKYGYISVIRQGDGEQEWRAGSRVPHVKRARMVKLMQLIDVLVSGKKSTYYFRHAPTLDRYHGRYAWVRSDDLGVLKFRTHYSKKYQIRESDNRDRRN